MSDKTQLVQNLFTAIDSKNADKFVSHLTDDATFTMGEQDPITGKENIRAAVGGFFESIKGLSHKVDKVIEKDDNLVTPGNVTYTRHDGSELSVSFCNVYKLENDKIKDYDVFIDLSQLYQ